MAFQSNDIATVSLPMLPTLHIPNAPIMPMSIQKAVAFLTRPLVLTLAHAELTSFKAILADTLCIALGSRSRIALNFAHGRLPPRAVFEACRTAGVRWAEWSVLLFGGGAVGRDFDLVISTDSVSVTYGGVHPQRIVLWREEQEQEPEAPIQRRRIANLTFDDVVGDEVPISKLLSSSPVSHSPSEYTHEEPLACSASQIQASLVSTLHSAHMRYKQRQRTLAQELMEAEGIRDAEELFTLLSFAKPSTDVLSPTPTRERFPAWDEPTAVSCADAFPAMLISPVVSRPSSRSSTVSSGSTSLSDDESVITAASSVSSVEFDYIGQQKAETSPTTISVPLASLNVQRTPAVGPRFARAATTQRTPPTTASPRVYTNPAKKDLTKYLYQGGVSTVLTGGVMLGTPAPAPRLIPKLASALERASSRLPPLSLPLRAPRPALPPAPRYTPPKETANVYKAPIGAERRANFVQKHTAASATSWRRAPALRI